MDHAGPSLHLYGDGALETLDNAPNPTHGPSVEEVHFHYMEFEEIAPLLSKMSRGFPHVRVSCELNSCLVVITWDSCDPPKEERAYSSKYSLCVRQN